MEVEGGVGVDDGCVGEDVGGRLGVVEEGERVVEAAEGGVGALELEGEDSVGVEEVVAEEGGVDLEEVFNGFGGVDEIG